MARPSLFSSLSVRLTVAFLLAATLGVALVAVLAYRSTSSEFGLFVRHVEDMDSMMGGGMMGGMGPGGPTFAQAQRDFLGNLGQSLWIAGAAGVILALLLGGLFTRQIVAPLGKVAAAARRVAHGDLTQRVDIRGSGELAALGASFNDMANTLARDRELRQSMIADIAHELHTPLAILQGNVEAMQDGVLEASSENLASLHQETLLLARLVEDLRTLSLAEAGQLQLQPGATDLKALATQVIEGFQPQLAARGLSVSLESPEELPPAWTDPQRTAQALRNLLANAAHYTPEGGSISVRLSAGDHVVSVAVTDTGIGIPPEDLSRIFDRFYRVDRSRSRSTGGSGLGLAIVKQLVEGQGGHVWAESTFGLGSTFTFQVPRVPA